MPEGIAGESAPFLWHHIDLCYWGRHRWSSVEFVWDQDDLGFHVITAGCYVNDGEGMNHGSIAKDYQTPKVVKAVLKTL